MKYIILSPKHGTPDEPMFWRAADCGYVNSPFLAGQYDESTIMANPDYYNDGYAAVAIPLTDKAMADLGFKCSYDKTSLKSFLNKQVKKSTTQVDDPDFHTGGLEGAYE